MESKNIIILQKTSKLTPSPRLLTHTHTYNSGGKTLHREQGIQYAEQQLQKTNLDVSGCYRSKYKNRLGSWKKITSDRVIIYIVRHGLKEKWLNFYKRESS